MLNKRYHLLKEYEPEPPHSVTHKFSIQDSFSDGRFMGRFLMRKVPIQTNLKLDGP
jgi:hypothetical protein